MALFFVPLSVSTYVNIPREQMGNASGVFNLLGNLGGSFGAAVSTTLLYQRSHLHQNFLIQNITPFNPAFRDYASQLSHFFGSGFAGNSRPLLEGVYREVLRQANMLAFNDIFWLFAWLTALLIPLILLMKTLRERPFELHSNIPRETAHGRSANP